MSDALKARALRLLSMREHSRAELARKLGAAAGDGNDGDGAALDALLDRLEEIDLLSDVRFAESYVRSRQDRIGTQRLRLELKQRSVADAVIEAALASEVGADDAARAHSVWQKKFGTLPANAREWAKQARFLQGRGFAADIIHRILKDRHDESA